jgi:hypothetical protein
MILWSRLTHSFCFYVQMVPRCVQTARVLGALRHNPSAAHRLKPVVPMKEAWPLPAPQQEVHVVLADSRARPIEPAVEQVARKKNKTKKKIFFRKIGCMLLGDVCCGTYRCSAGQACFSGSCVAALGSGAVNSKSVSIWLMIVATLVAAWH